MNHFKFESKDTKIGTYLAADSAFFLVDDGWGDAFRRDCLPDAFGGADAFGADAFGADVFPDALDDGLPDDFIDAALEDPESECFSPEIEDCT